MLKELNSILALRKNHTRGRPGDRNAEEVGDGPKIRHGKLQVQMRNEVLKKPISRGSENDVVYIKKDVGEIGAMLVYEQRNI
jgi:hypothetical protein